MSAAETLTAQDALYLVDKYAERSSTRKKAIPLASEKSGISVGALRTTVWRANKKKTTPFSQVRVFGGR